MQNSVKMIRHDYEFIQKHMRKMTRDALPTFRGSHANPIQLHLAIHDITKQAFTLKRTDRHEIRTCAAIIVIPQTDGTAVVDVMVERHAFPHIVGAKQTIHLLRPDLLFAIKTGRSRYTLLRPYEIYAASTSFNSSSIGQSSSPKS